MNKGYLARKRKRSVYNYTQVRKSTITRLPRTIKSNELKLRCEYIVPVSWVATNAFYSFPSIAGPPPILNPTYINVTQILQNSPSFIKYGGLYSKLKIKGFTITASSARGLNGNAITDYLLGFYPNIKNSASSTDVIGHDQTYHVPVSLDKFIKFSYFFNKSAYNGPDGTGYGIWFNPSKIGSLDGQFSIQTAVPIVASPLTMQISFIKFRFFLGLLDPIF